MKLKEKILQRMESLGIEPKRSLGQNFLISDRVVERIIASAEPASFKEVYEIGPGLGALTDALSEVAPHLRLVELDRTFAEYWRQRAQKVEELDALKYPWQDLSDSLGPRLLVSNLPYQISSRIVVELSLLSVFQRMVLMFQKEVAQRMEARPGTADYGLLTVVAQSFWKIRRVSEVGPMDFFPKPNVASRVLQFDDFCRLPQDLNPKDYLDFLKRSFANRRKVLLPKLTFYKSKEKLSQRFADLQLEEQVRAERLSCDQFIALYRAIKTE